MDDWCAREKFYFDTLTCTWFIRFTKVSQSCGQVLTFTVLYLNKTRLVAWYCFKTNYNKCRKYAKSCCVIDIIVQNIATLFQWDYLSMQNFYNCFYNFESLLDVIYLKSMLKIEISFLWSKRKPVVDKSGFLIKFLISICSS